MNRRFITILEQNTGRPIRGQQDAPEKKLEAVKRRKDQFKTKKRRRQVVEYEQRAISVVRRRSQYDRKEVRDE